MDSDVERARTLVRQANPLADNVFEDNASRERAQATLQRILTVDSQPQPDRRRLSSGIPMRLAATATVGLVAAMAIGVVLLDDHGHGPGSGSNQTLSAYVESVTGPHGTVTFPASSVKDPLSLQTRMRSAGVPATVLAESAPGLCHQRAPAGIVPIPDDAIKRTRTGLELNFRKSQYPKGATLLVLVPPPQPKGTAVIAFTVIAGKVPSCVSG